MSLLQETSHSPRRNVSIIPRLIILLMVLILTSSIVYSVMWRPGAGAFLSALNLKADSCALLAQQGMTIFSASPTDRSCSVMMPFRSNPFSHGGIIYLHDQAFSLAAEQLIAQQLVDEPTAIQSRRYDLMMIIACIAFLLGSFAWVFRIGRK